MPLVSPVADQFTFTSSRNSRKPVMFNSTTSTEKATSSTSGGVWSTITGDVAWNALTIPAWFSVITVTYTSLP